MTFHILDHADKLTPSEEKGRYVCPGCGGNNLTISQDGAYQCWNGCECREIREAITPLSERSQRRQVRKSKVVSTRKSTPLPSADICLARLETPATDSPLPVQAFDEKLGEVFKTIYTYSVDSDGRLEHWVVRTDWGDSSKPKGLDRKIGIQAPPFPGRLCSCIYFFSISIGAAPTDTAK